MTDPSDILRPTNSPADRSLASLGWSVSFQDQVAVDEAGLAPRRISTVHRDRLTALSPAGPVRLHLPVRVSTGDLAVGDWVLVDPETEEYRRRLTRKTVLERYTEGNKVPQLIAANVDTLFIVTSCNADFNPSRLERYLALSNEAGTRPVILITKADTVEDAAPYREQAAALQDGLTVVMVNPRSAETVTVLAPYCGVGETVALVGSSGVGKSTLVNTLVGPGMEIPQQTGDIREHDAKGRHTTTARSLHPASAGGWIIDTPGIRSLHLGGSASGIDTLFADIVQLSPLCRFNDCTHVHEPGCAILGAVAEGTLDPERVERWRNLHQENRDNAPVAAGMRGGAGPARRGKWR